MSNIRVSVRVRPTRPSETNHITCDDRIGSKLTVRLPQEVTREFGSVLGPGSRQLDVYAKCGAPMVESALRGEDALLFTCGQSGSGKTHTMYGANGGGDPDRLDGVVPSIVGQLWRRITSIEKQGEEKFAVGATLVEVQGSHVMDLLASDEERAAKPYVRVLGAQLVGAKVERVYSQRSFAAIVERAMRNRITEPAGAAAGPGYDAKRGGGGGGSSSVVGGGSSSSSSAALAASNLAAQHGQARDVPYSGGRGHCFLTLTLEKRTFADGKLMGTSSSVMHMIDLAGAETFDFGHRGSGHAINHSAMALFRVILALNEGNPHVPYRDDTLTQLLSSVLASRRPYWGTMIVHVNPGEAQATETHNTLEYALKARSTYSAYWKRASGGAPAPAATDTESVGSDVLNLDFEGDSCAEDDPMVDDQHDADEEMNRRTEVIDTKWGSVFCRSCGDPTHPLVLYVHDVQQGAGSSQWNGCVAALASAKRDSWRAAEAEAPAERRSENKPRPIPALAELKHAKSSIGDALRERSVGLFEREEEEDRIGANQQEMPEYDERFAKLRAKMSTALLRRQRELAQTVCSLCSALLLQPRRLLRCRHVLCALCVERSTLYHCECPVCTAPSNGLLQIDYEHDELMRMRIEALPETPLMIVSWQTRLDEAEAERRRTLRVLLEFGSIVAGAGEKGKVTVFVGLLREGTSNP